MAELDRRIRGFIEDDGTYRIEPEQAPDRNEIWVYITVLRNPPVREWAPIFSDVVNGLRASFDNMVWALSARRQRGLKKPVPSTRIEPSGPFGRWRNVAFPVVTDSSQWRRTCERNLWAIDQTLVDTFRNVQPFMTGQNRPEREPICIAHELWNVDKHRHVALARLWVGGKETEIRVTANPPLERLQFRTIWVAQGRVFKSKTKTKIATAVPLFTVSAVNVPGNPTHVGFPVSVEHGIPFDISFKRGYPGFGCLAIETLESVHETARDLLRTLRRHL
ncbi:MAG TPA: hypothetical protein VK988_17465 [Acidimicrobiales bacterium]|nr:hypothetical protein [Acidimicrobiales bacterium]